MGTFQSKFALKRRQSPEGGSLTSNVLNSQQELEQIHIHKLTENLYLELRGKKSDSSRDPKVTLLPKKRSGKRHSFQPQVRKKTKKRSSHAGVTECNVEPGEDAQQEWVFTLYNTDNKKGKSSLIRSIHEVLEESVKQPRNTAFPLRIKLVVMPSLQPGKTSQIAAEKKADVSQEVSGRRLYCVDENLERRNHYMDLAGIENFSSKFEDTEPPSVKSRHKPHSALQHHHVVIRENSTAPDSLRGLPGPCFQKSRSTSAGKERNGGEGKSRRLHRSHSASCCHHVPQTAAQCTHSRRLRSKVQDAAYSPYFSCEAPASSAQRHEHHHQHEHHHHHHHHYRPS